MPDAGPAPPAYASGNVIIEAGDTAPVVKLSAASVRLPVRELADLIAHTARDAAEAMRTDAADKEAGPGSAADALAELKNLRDGIRSDGLESVIDRKRTDFGVKDDAAVSYMNEMVQGAAEYFRTMNENLDG